MKYIERIEELVRNKEIQETSINILGDAIDALLGDPVSAGKIILTLLQSPFLIREKLFWSKIERFLNGVYLEDDDRAKLRAKLTKCGEESDNPYRLIEYIDRAETKQKIRFLINATRSLLSDYIDLSIYFRICHTITHTLQEDLLFLQAYIKENDLSYNPCIQGLLTSGLMYQSVLDGNGDQKFSFTPTAELVDQYAVSYDDIHRYPTWSTIQKQRSVPRTSVSLSDSQIATDEEVREMLKDVFEKPSTEE